MSTPRVSVGGELYAGKGMMWIDRYVSGVPTGNFRAMGSCDAISIVPGSIDKITKRDSTIAAAPILASATKGQTHQIKISMSQVNVENLALFAMGNASVTAISGASVTAESHAGVKPGYAINLAHQKITAASVVVNVSPSTLKAEGTDYVVDYIRGMIYIVEGGTIADGVTILVDYAYGARSQRRVSGAVNGTILAALRFVSDPAYGEKWDLQVWNASLTPEGEFAFIGEDFVQFSLVGDIQSDAVNHPTEPNYRYEDLS